MNDAGLAALVIIVFAVSVAVIALLIDLIQSWRR